MTTKLTTFEEEKWREFDKTIQDRTLNEDNPQYVLGWNACRYLSRDFLCQALRQQREMIRKEVEKLEGKPIHYLDILSPLSDKEKGDGSVRCCDNGDMDERHECLKSNRK